MSNAKLSGSVDSTVSPEVSEGIFEKKFTNALESENTRDFVKKIVSEDIRSITDELSCTYSSRRYEDFQSAVKKISKSATKEFMEDQAWKQKQFWIPIAISVIGLIISRLGI